MTTDYSLSERIKEVRFFKGNGITKLFLNKTSGKPIELVVPPTDVDAFVQSVVAGTNVTVDSTDPANPIVSASGGSGSSSTLITHLVFPFDHTMDTALASGIDVGWVPMIDDVLINAWIEGIDTWNGTTPFADIGFFDIGGATGRGLFSYLAATAQTLQYPETPLGTFSGLMSMSLSRALSGDSIRIQSTPTTAFQVVVSQDGTKGGTPSGSTSGLSKLHLLILE